MPPEVLTETDDIIDEADIKIVEAPAADIPVPTDPAPAPEDDDDDDDDEDARLGDSEDGDDGLTDEQRRKRESRRKKADYRKRVRLRNEAELQELRALVPQLANRLAAVEGHTVASSQTTLQAQLQQAEADAATALELQAQAVEAGNGTDAVRAQVIREQALARVSELKSLSRQTPQQSPTSNPDVVRLATAWTEQNKGWYGPNPEATMLAKAIDAQVAAEGFNPASPSYWQEVTTRVTRALDDAGMLQRQPASAAPGAPPAPIPTGMGRQHAPASTKTQYLLSQDRVQAMKDGGIWDDPVRRTKQIKAFQQYDRENGSPNSRG